MKGLARRFSYIVPCSVLVLLAMIAVHGQTVSGTLRGTVTDTNDALVPNATVTIRNIETGFERTVVTSNEGVYNIPFLPIGNYTVETSQHGLQQGDARECSSQPQ